MYRTFIIIAVVLIIFWLITSNIKTNVLDNTEGYVDQYYGENKVTDIYIRDFLDYIDWFQINRLTIDYKPLQFYWFKDMNEEQLEVLTRRFMDTLYTIIVGSAGCNNLYKEMFLETKGIVHLIKNHYKDYEFEVDMDSLTNLIDLITNSEEFNKRFNKDNIVCKQIYIDLVKLMSLIANTQSYKYFVNNNRSQSIYAGYALNTYMAHIV